MFDDFRSTALLPKTEEAVAGVIGRAAAVRLSHRVFQLKPYRHGRWQVDGIVYVPKTVNKKFRDLVGNSDDATKLSHVFGGESLFLTGCRSVFKQLQHHVIRFLYRKGITKARIARLSLMTERQIRRICAGETIDSLPSGESLIDEMRSLHAFSVFISRMPC